MFPSCGCSSNKMTAIPVAYSWKCLLSLLLTALVGTTADLQLVPEFTIVPPLVTPFIGSPGNASLGHPAALPPLVDLICRAWPPNARISLVASPRLTEGTAFTLAPLTGVSPAVLQYAILSRLSDQDQQTASPTNTIVEQYFDSLNEAVRHRPGARPADEVAVRLTVSDTGLTTEPDPVKALLDRLERMHLFCRVETPLGSLVSRPFHVRSTAIGDFPPHPPSVLRSGPSPGLTPYSLPIGFPDDMRSPATVSLNIFLNNLGVIDCLLPMNAYPEPVVQVELNGSFIDVHSARYKQKYRLVHRPDSRRVSLLIRQLQPQDAGFYRCFFVNPLTGERKVSPAPVVHLQVNRPIEPEHPTVFTPLASGAGDARSADGVEQAKAQVITVAEGDNLTLFCVIHAAPPPTVTTYPFQLNTSRHQRFRREDLFGLLHITAVQPEDAGFYVCSEGQISSTAQLRVMPRLQLIKRPQDTKIAQLGGSVEFECATSDPSVSPEWLVNGRPVERNSLRRSAGSTKLTISSVGHGDLGFYQCLAWRQPSRRREKHEGEWVNATAMLTLASDELLATPDSVVPYLPKTAGVQDALSSPSDNNRPGTSGEAPLAETIFDNLAVLLTWPAVSLPPSIELATAESGREEQTSYRLEYAVQQTAVEVVAAAGANASAAPPSSGRAAARSPVELANTLSGFVGFEAIRWSEPRPLGQPMSTPYLFVASPPLEPGKRYRFRVIAQDPAGGVSTESLQPSSWSKTVSMEHISSATPPEIQLVRHLSNGQVRVIWKFDDQPPGSALDPATAADHPRQQSELFNADYFYILARPVVKPKRGASDSIEYGAYLATQVNGSQTREGFLTGLNRSLDYQVIVYAVRGAEASRQITRFSRPVFVNSLPAATGQDTRYSILASLARNRVLYMVLGGIAALMIFVVFLLILLCMCRQLRDGSRPASSAMAGAAERKKQNGYLRGNPTSGGNNPPDGIHHQQQHSTVDGSNPATGACGLALGSQPDYHPHLRQSLVVNPYTPLPDGKEPLLSGSAQQQQQQQQQQFLGSQFHLSYYHHNPANGSMQGQVPVPPHHHQSHHSLLLSPTTAVGPGRVFQTGTLPTPGSQPHHHQQQQRYYRAGAYNTNNGRAMTPGPMLEMTEYPGGGYQPHHHHHQQQQQQQMYAPHQQLPPIPPQQHQQPVAHQMGVYYPTGYSTGQPHHPGLMTPGAMSLKREQGLLPAGGGSLREHNSTYGTLLQRGAASANHLTGSFINDQQQQAVNSGATAHPLSGVGTLQPAGAVPMATYFQSSMGGGQMLQNHPTHLQAYQQQQQLPTGAYYDQQMPSEIMFVPTPGSQQHLHQQYQQQQQPSFRANDGTESVYSYFSQHEASGNPIGVGGHQYLNALPEESNLVPGTTGYVDSGMQTAAAVGDHLHSNNNNNVESPPTGVAGGSIGQGAASSGHRHHRRRKRKQPGQGQRQTSESTGGVDPDQHQLMHQQHQQQSDDQLSQTPAGFSGGGGGGTDSQADDNQMHPSDPSDEMKRKLSLTGAGTYSDADPMSGQTSFVYPPGYHLQQQQQQQQHSFETNNNNNGSLSNCRYDSPQRATINGGCPPALPPPNQPPPPPPPPPNAAMTFAGVGCDGLPSGELQNGVGAGGYPSGVVEGQAYSPGVGVNPGFIDYRRGYSLAAGGGGGAGLLVGPPPRVRDYSEYGIPRGIGLPPTPDGSNNHTAGSPPPPAIQQQQQQLFKGHVDNNGMMVMMMPHRGALVNGLHATESAAQGQYPFNGSAALGSSYREGQA